jgi:hypothetical protein
MHCLMVLIFFQQSYLSETSEASVLVYFTLLHENNRNGVICTDQESIGSHFKIKGLPSCKDLVRR